MRAVNISKDRIAVDGIPHLAFGYLVHRDYYFVTSIIRGNLADNQIVHIPKMMSIIMHVSPSNYPFLEVRHVAHPNPVILNYRRLSARGFSLPDFIAKLEDEVFFAEQAYVTRDGGKNTFNYRETWRSLYSIVHQNGRPQEGVFVTAPVRTSNARKRLLTVISAYKQMAVPIKVLNTIEEKLEVIEALERIFTDDYEYYACLRTYIIDVVGYRLFIETAPLEKFVVPLRVRQRKTLVKSLLGMTTSISTLRDHQGLGEKIGNALKHCYRIHNFN